MKPMGPIPPEFAAQQGALIIGGRSASAWMEGRDGPLFVYDPAIVAARVARFRAAFPTIDLHYAIKANPFPPLLAAMAAMVDGFDVASAGELAKVADLSRPVSFAGPGKRDAELTAAIAAGITLNLESEGEARRALVIADRLGRTPRLAVRVNPDVELRGSGMKMGGRPSPFGIDAERVPALVRDLIAAVEASEGEAIETTPDILSKLSGKDNPQAVVGVFEELGVTLDELDRNASGIWLTSSGVSECAPSCGPVPVGTLSATSETSRLVKMLPTTAVPRVAPT